MANDHGGNANRDTTDDNAPSDITRVRIVGVGASAGGLEAFRQLLDALPTDTGMAFVLVSHLAPDHASTLSAILQRATAMPVVEIADGVVVESDHVYVIPPGCFLTIADGALGLTPRASPGHSHVVDHFFDSLANEQRQSAIGVVLSGSANDGTHGLESIKAAGGITFAQDDSAQHDGMPRSAIESGCVDFVLSPGAIAREIAAISIEDGTSVVANEHNLAQEASVEDAAPLSVILELVLRTMGIDFAGYKSTTLLRRVKRRMTLQQMDNLSQYVEFLKQQPAEVAALHDDLLIGVTSFFRNPPAFAALAEQVLPKLIERNNPRDPIRVWVVGCSTGEEAYSLAIELTELAERHRSTVPIQMFATDLNASAIEQARRGVYSKSITENVSPERLRRFFVESEGGYRIGKAVRDVCIFSPHNLVTDPPFSRIDLLSCRNLLIYLEPALQHRVIPTLHYALKPQGYLWLGGAEALGAYRNLFDTLDPKHKIYTKRGDGGLGARVLNRARAPSLPFVSMASRGVETHGNLHREADRILLNRYAPPAVLVSRELDILEYRGDTGPYLSPAPGEASLNLLKMLRPELLVPIHSAIISAGNAHASVRVEDLRVKTSDGYSRVAVEVVPMQADAALTAGGYLVSFEGEASHTERAQAAVPNTDRDETLADRNHADLVRELADTREYLRRVIEQHEAANEELQSASEEVQSANEELQSANEELETSKEEIQSSNEELSIYNDELNSRNTELLRLNGELNNLLDSVDMAIVILGRNLEVRRFTPAAERQFGLPAALRGQRFDAGAVNFDMPDLATRLTQVIKTGAPAEQEVRNAEGHWYSLRLRPYLIENRVEGVIAILVDVEDIKSAQAYQESIIATVREPLLVLDSDLRVQTANASFLELFQTSVDQTEGRLIYQLGDGEWNVHELRDLLEHVLPNDLRVSDFSMDREFSRTGHRSLLINATRLVQAPTEAPRILLSIQDVTQAEAVLRDSEERFKTMADNIAQFAWMADSHGWIFWFNRRWFEYTGSVLSDVQGDGWRKFHHPDHRGRIEEWQRHSRGVGAPWEDTFPIRGKDGTYRWFLSRAQPTFDATGKVVRWFGTHTDVTEQREHAASLQEADRRKDEFIAMLAHELRNPLAPIVNALKAIRSVNGDDQQIRAASDVMQRQVDHLVRLVDDLLDVGRVASGRIRLRKEPTALNSAFTSAIDAARTFCTQKGQVLTINLPPSSAHVDGDPIRLAQVVENLLTNASKFTPRGGQIDVTVENDGDVAVIRVRDSGVGIEQHELSRIFEMFTQVDTSLERSTSGLGIGLTLSRTIVELHGGTIEAKSAGIGRGSEFIVRLPTIVVSAAEPAQRSGSGPTALFPRRILVVDDNRDGAESLARVLELSGQETRVAADGAAALVDAEGFRPDVVLLDIGLPKLNGFEVARKIRQAPWGKSMILVAITGWGQEEHRRESSDAGFDAHLVKPVDPAKLIRLLASLTHSA